MILVQYIFCIMVPVVLFLMHENMLGVVAIINLFVHIWSSEKFIKMTGKPPGSLGTEYLLATVSGSAISNNQLKRQYMRFLIILNGVNHLTLFLAFGFPMYIAIDRLL